MLRKEVFVCLLVTFLSFGFAGVVLAEGGEGINPFAYHFNTPGQVQTLQAIPTVGQADHPAALPPTGLSMSELDSRDLYGVAARTEMPLNLVQNNMSEAVAQSEVPVSLLPTGLGMSELDARDINAAASRSEGVDKKHQQTLCSTVSGVMDVKSSQNCGDAVGG